MRTNENQIIAKPHRLDVDAYITEGAVVFTACVEGRARPFNDAVHVTHCLQLLSSATAKEGCRCTLYVFMPDHLHLILRGNQPGSSVLNCMKRFKQSSGFYLSKHGYRWHKSFYDRVVRSPEELREQVCYILANPVRAGLVRSCLDWPHLGTSTGSIEDLLAELQWF